MSTQLAALPTKQKCKQNVADTASPTYFYIKQSTLFYFMKVEECHRICMLCQVGDNGEICTMDSSEKTHTVSCGSSVYKQDKCLSKHSLWNTYCNQCSNQHPAPTLQHVTFKVLGDSATTFETHNSCILQGLKPEGRITLVRPRNRWEDNIKMDLQEMEWGGGHRMD